MKFFITYSKLKKIFLIVLLNLLPVSCEKESCDVIPDTYINLSLNMILFNLAPTQSMVINNTVAGVSSLGYDNNGIIIYCNSNDEYFAYDRTCAYDIDESVPVDIPGNFMYAVCPVCSSKYLLWYSGFPSDESVSKCPLKQYKTAFNPNTDILYIYN